jgi:hypothetical protein
MSGNRARELAEAIARCELRQKHAEQQLARFVETKVDGAAADRQHRKLLADHDLAANDVSVLRSMLLRECGRDA